MLSARGGDPHAFPTTNIDDVSTPIRSIHQDGGKPDLCEVSLGLLFLLSLFLSSLLAPAALFATPRPPAMGIKDGYKVLGIKALSTAVNLTPACEGASCALEGAGLLTLILLTLLNDERAEPLARHIHVGGPIPEELFVVVLGQFIRHIKSLQQIFTGGVIVVFEGPMFPLKSVATDRSSTRAKKFTQRLFKGAVCVTDCMVRMLLAALLTERILFMCPPAEADGLLAFLLVRGIVQYLLIPSGDSDLLFYPGVTRVVYCCRMRMWKTKGTAAKTARLFGARVMSEGIWQARDVVISKATRICIPLHNLDFLMRVVLAQLLGSDYCKISGCGMKKAVAAIVNVVSWREQQRISWPPTSLDELVSILREAGVKNITTAEGKASLARGLCGFLIHPVWHLLLPPGETGVCLSDYSKAANIRLHQRLYSMCEGDIGPSSSAAFALALSILHSPNAIALLGAEAVALFQRSCEHSHSDSPPAPITWLEHMQSSVSSFGHCNCCNGTPQLQLSALMEEAVNLFERKGSWESWSDPSVAPRLPSLSIIVLLEHLKKFHSDGGAERRLSIACERLGGRQTGACTFSALFPPHYEMNIAGGEYDLFIRGYIDQSYDGEMQQHPVAIRLRVRRDRDGARAEVISIAEAACDCVSRIGKCCTHIAALLFALHVLPETNVTTSQSCSWLGPRVEKAIVQAMYGGVVSVENFKVEHTTGKALLKEGRKVLKVLAEKTKQKREKEERLKLKSQRLEAIARELVVRADVEAVAAKYYRPPRKDGPDERKWEAEFKIIGPAKW